MGSIRTWSLAAVAGLMVVVVTHQSSVAGAPAPLPATPGSQAAASSPAAALRPAGPRVTGLPDFSDLVAENGASVVNISVVEKAGKGGSEPGEGGDPLSQFFHHPPMPGPEHSPPARGIGSGFIITPDGYGSAAEDAT